MQLEQIADGKYSTEGTRAITVAPEQLIVHPAGYMLPGVLGKTEAEDVAARIIEVAQQNGQWTALTYRTLGEPIAKAVGERQQYHKALRERQKAEMAANDRNPLADAAYGLLAWVTGNEDYKPQQPEIPEEPIAPEGPESPIVNLITFSGSPSPFVTGIKYMVDEGYLDQFDTTIGGEDQTVLIPTQKLAETVYQKQNP